MKNVLVMALVALLAGGGVYYFTKNSGGAPAGPGGFGGQRQSAPLVVVSAVAYEQLYDTVNAIGTAQANESLILTAKVTDTVRRVAFEDGELVEAGAILVELTNQEEEALLAEARANLDDAESQLRRLENLSERGLAADSDLDIARSRAAASEARKTAAPTSSSTLPQRPSGVRSQSHAENFSSATSALLSSVAK